MATRVGTDLQFQKLPARCPYLVPDYRLAATSTMCRHHPTIGRRCTGFSSINDAIRADPWWHAERCNGGSSVVIAGRLATTVWNAT